MRRTLALPILLAAIAPWLFGQKAAPYFPPSGQWQHKPPAEEGLDPAKLQQAIDYALAHPSTWDFAKDQVRTFGTPLGPLPEKRAGTNGIIVRHGYIVAQFGDVKAVDPVYSTAKSFLSTVCSIAVARGLIHDVNDPVARYIHDGGYDSPHNAKITWKNHLQQTSEWEGTLWDKNANFIGVEQFGNGKRDPREIHARDRTHRFNPSSTRRRFDIRSRESRRSFAPSSGRSSRSSTETGSPRPRTAARGRSAGSAGWR